uniref:SH3 domain-containing protein n=1 Tax=Nothoprocta perdicaria TaxID=30464 RepID=A0A8C6ZAW1_NOTPE
CRLELLLHIANKIHNGALNCEEKLTFAKNLLQADTAHLQSGQPVQKESDVVMYLQECEVLIRQLQVDVQILRDENYYQLEELVIRITRLQEELQALRLECTNLYRKGNFPALGHMPISMQSIIHVKREALSKGLHTSSGSWFRKPMTRTELVAISSSEDEGSLRFVYELLAWVEEMQVSPGLLPPQIIPKGKTVNDLCLSRLPLKSSSVLNLLRTLCPSWLGSCSLCSTPGGFSVRLDRAEWGNDLPSVESHMETQRHVHSSVEELASSVKEGKISRNFRTSYAETLGKLKTQYCKLLETSSFRLKHLQSLHGFVSQATAELIWLNEREEEELAYDWSDKNPNIAAKKIYFSEMTMELEEKRGVFWSLQDTAEMLSLQNHPAKQTVEAYSAAVQTQWQWIKQLCLCVEQHVKENTAYFQFFSDARESEAYLRSLQDSIKRKYTCDHNMSLSQLEDLLQDSMDEKEQLIQAKSSVASLTGQSKTIVQLKPRNPDHVLKSTIPIKAVCNYSQIEITICVNDECVLEDNSQRTKWKVISPTGNEAMVPSVCFLIPAPNKEAIETANRVEELYQKVIGVWHQLHVNMKSVISWNYLRKDLTLVNSSLLEEDCQRVMKSLQAHHEDFQQDCRDSQMFCVSDQLSLEEEVESSKEYMQQLLESLEKGELQRLDGLTRNSNVQSISERCYHFFKKAPAGPSTPHLRSELDLLFSTVDQIDARSAIYQEKLKTLDAIIRNTQGAESLVKDYEVKLSQEEAVPADLMTLQSHRSTLQQWLGEVKDKSHMFSSLEDDLGKAEVVTEKLQQRLRQERNIDLERYQEKVNQLRYRWQRISALAAEIEKNQAKLDQCQKFSQQYSAAVKDYELQLMTYRAFVESQQKSPMKRRRMPSSSDVITQEFMDLRTQYTALVTLTTQHVKYISDALRRLEEEEKQEHVDKVKELLGWASGLRQSVQGKTAAAPSRELVDIEKSILEQQVSQGPALSSSDLCMVPVSLISLLFLQLNFC